MYSILSAWLSDKEGGYVFSCFDIWHCIYLVIVASVITVTICCLKNKDQSVKNKVIKIFINIAFGLYIADFFLMPFAYGEIDIDKLPFHSCTAMCVMCFLSNHSRFLGKYRLNFALLGFISNLIYVVYPAGIMWYEIHPLSYRAIQTLMFHATMAIYCLLTLIFNSREMKLQKCYRDLVIVVCMTCWAFLGNVLYSGETEEYSRTFNWFFVRQDPLDVIPTDIAPYIMPALNIVAFFAVEMLIYLICIGVQRIIASRNG